MHLFNSWTLLNTNQMLETMPGTEDWIVSYVNNPVSWCTEGHRTP